jgi:hypothetical protein
MASSSERSRSEKVVSIEWSQVSALGVIAAAVAVCIVLAFGVVSLIRGVWTWVAGQEREAPKVGATPEAILPGAVVTASDIFAIRSNLAAVARQLEDLESKLRLNPPKR